MSIHHEGLFVEIVRHLCLLCHTQICDPGIQQTVKMKSFGQICFQRRNIFNWSFIIFISRQDIHLSQGRSQNIRARYQGSSNTGSEKAGCRTRDEGSQCHLILKWSLLYVQLLFCSKMR